MDDGLQAPATAAAALAALDAPQTLPELFARFEQLIRPYGYTSLDYASGPVVRWPMRSNLDWRADVVYATYDWAEVYFGTDFQKHDRMLPHMLRQTGPWLYWDVWGTPTDDPVTAELDRRAQEKVASGLSIPFHGPGLRFAGVNLGSDLSPAALEARDRETRAEVFLLASRLHERVQRLGGDAPPVVVLTPRERDCLGSAAEGRTAAETAEDLGVSESAVKKHLAGAARKLGARTGAHAVAIALSRGLIGG